jgi:predicted RNase H-like HicB family nuclease
MPKRSSKARDVKQLGRSEPPPLIAYLAHVTREGRYWLAEFPECPGCQTFGLSEQDLRRMAEEALAEWLEARLSAGEVPPEPKATPSGKSTWAIPVEAILSANLRRTWSGEGAPKKNTAAVSKKRRAGAR